MMGVLSNSTELNQPVLVQLPGQIGSVLGFLTNRTPGDEVASLPEGSVAVYIPMSYQVGGFTLFTDPANITPVDGDRENLLRFILTAGMRESTPEANAVELATTLDKDGNNI